MAEHAISFSHVSVTLPGSTQPVLRDVDLAIAEGELALVVGRTGSGKSTLLGAMCGRVPHFTGGTLTGHVRLHGRDTRDHRPRDLADLVGVVGQDPLAGFVTDTVEEELAYGMEQLGLPAATMRKRVEETLDLLGIAELRDVALRELSGGQQQRVAIGSVLTAHPRVILLDEPTSALDPTGAEEVLATITRLVHDLAVTVVVAEHRVERVLHYADTVVHVSPSGEVDSGEPADLMVDSDVASPVVELGRYAGWSPLPLSVRDARRAARVCAPADRHAGPGTGSTRGRVGSTVGTSRSRSPPATSSCATRRRPRRPRGRPRPARRRGHRTHGPQRFGQVLAAVGAPGQRHPHLGDRPRGCEPPADRRATDPGGGERRALVGLVPQTAADLLYLDSVGAECDQADRESAVPSGTCARLLDAVAPGIPTDQHPRDLSEGQQLALVLAVQLTADAPVLLLDEPTRGLDYRGQGAPSAACCADARPGRAGDRRVDARRRVRRRVRGPGGRAGGGRGRRRRSDRRRASSSPARSRRRWPRSSPRAVAHRRRRARGARRRWPHDGARTRALTLARGRTGRDAGQSSPGWSRSAGRSSSPPTPGSPTAPTPPIVFALVLPLLLAVVLAQLSEGGMDAKAVAMLGVLSAIGAALRPLGAGTAGVETVFFLLVLGGRVFGAGFGFVLGATTLFASALLTGGVGPWLPFQMLGAAWVGWAPGCCRRCAAGPRSLMLAGYGAVAGARLRPAAQPVVLAVHDRAERRAVVRRRARR